MITTTHAYTSSQVTVDKRSKKRRRGRAAAVNIIPTTTGAAIATVETIPSLEGKMEAMALRVPVPDGAITEVVAILNKTAVVGDNMVKVMAWYDNEYGYSQRLLEVADYIASKMN